jgi:outer membrane protein insertion porin family
VWLSWLLVCSLLTTQAGAAEADSRVGIAILPLVVHSAESPEYLREGLADMLVSRLEQVRQFRVIRIDDSSKATTRLSTALQIAREAGADFALFGSFTRFGQGASLDVQCAATASGAEDKPLREIFVHSGSIGDVIPDLDELVGKLSRFAIADFQASAAATGEPTKGSTASRRSVDELRKRVDALESALQRLSGEPNTAAGPPAEN